MVNAIAHIDIKPPRRTQKRFVAGCAAAVAMTSEVVLGIRLHFHNHTPQQLAIRLALHKQAADQLGEDWETPGKRGGYGGGLRSNEDLMLARQTARQGRPQLKAAQPCIFQAFLHNKLKQVIIQEKIRHGAPQVALAVRE